MTTMQKTSTTWTPLDIGWLLLAQRVLTTPRRFNLLLALAESGAEGCTAANLAERLHVSPALVERELADLALMGVVSQTDGADGTFVLAEHPLKTHIERLARYTQRMAASS